MRELSESASVSLNNVSTYFFRGMYGTLPIRTSCESCVDEELTFGRFVPIEYIVTGGVYCRPDGITLYRTRLLGDRPLFDYWRRVASSGR